MALHVACRLALLSTAALALRGVLEGATFESSIRQMLATGSAAFLIGLIVGELTRRLIEDLVQADVQRILSSSLDSQNTVSGTVPEVQLAGRG